MIMSLEELKKYEWIIPWDGGKESTATVIKCIENDVPIKCVYISILMYDYKRDIPAINDEMHKFIIDTAEKWKQQGINVIIHKCKCDFVTMANNTFKRSKYEYKNGKKYGLACCSRRFCKLKFIKGNWYGEKEKPPQGKVLLGYTIYEVKRYKNLLNENKQSILCSLKLMQMDAYKICVENNMLLPTYKKGKNRNGCWFCANVSKDEFFNVPKELRNELYHYMDISADKDMFNNAYTNVYRWRNLDNN